MTIERVFDEIYIVRDSVLYMRNGIIINVLAKKDKSENYGQENLYMSMRRDKD